jgi:DNA repair exonuclease SbcCD ATPase subunit
MSVVFKKIKWCNFLSTGAASIEVDLCTYGSTLIMGSNGSGKSQILDAITFALFGKPFRDVNKPQLVNSINRKNCLVELEFEANGSVYVIKRGIKPNIFDILCNGELLTQDAALKDYQAVLEQQLIKMNYKTFTQVVILGSATFVPFMQLTANQRREVIEDILDIKVFSVMNQLLKEKTAAVKTQIQTVESEITGHKHRIASQKKIVDTLESSRQAAVESLRSKINANNDAIAVASQTIESIKVQMQELQKKSDKHAELTEAVQKAGKIKAKIAAAIEHIHRDVGFFQDNETCPSCAQTIADHHKHAILDQLDQKQAEQQSKLDEMHAVVEKLNAQLETAHIVSDTLRTLSIDMSTQSNTINILSSQNADLMQEIQSTTADTSNISEEKGKMRALAEEAIRQVEKKSSLLDQRQLHDVAGALLKDTGIKTAIIREYLPVVNKLINRYLAAMDFYVKFELDESFNETIKSRNRDVFTYASFSEGEKRRLDLSIILTWRQIAKMKNSVNTNLLFLDEILDGAMDATGIEYFMMIMDQMGEGNNVFVISHRDVADRFDRVIRVEKKGDFSVARAG